MNLTPVEAAAVDLERAERNKADAFSKAARAREEARRALTKLREAIVTERERRKA